MARSSLLNVLSASFGLVVTAGCLTSFELVDLYGPGLSPGAQIIHISDSNFIEQVTQRWTLYAEPAFYGAIKPATEADVQHIVRVSAAHNISFLATGRGHGASTTLEGLYGIEIDLSNFNSVNLDVANDLLTIGGAVNFSQLYEPLYYAGKMLRKPCLPSSYHILLWYMHLGEHFGLNVSFGLHIAMGNSPCVGVTGAMLGGTIGIFEGLFGLALDALESVRLVTATGDIVEVSETQHADLFWGIRGAGMNFGIVTSSTFRVYDAVNGGNATSTTLVYPGNQNGSVWEAVKSFDEYIPNELAITVGAEFNRTTANYNFTQMEIVANALYFGSAEEAEKYLTPFAEAGPLSTSRNEVSWPQFFSALSIADTTECVPGQYSNGYAIGLKQTDVPSFVSYFNKLADFSVKYPEFNGSFTIDRYPNAVALSVPDYQTAYPHREIKTHLLLESYYPNSTLDVPVNDLIQTARAQFQAMSGFEHLSVYVNFAHGDEGVDAWYTPRKLPNLTRLKRKWDPDQLFSWYFPVPL
ncbi:hypothetical protein F4804DRAFT_325398 [Jackrogersella minutella]|nr:hypothetical protein F4804DRAFT_325398 [Jackrogersella minutella]